MKFASIEIQLLAPLHIGTGRSGMVARSRGFVPGHIVSYALAAALGKARGGNANAFKDALELVRDSLRCGPWFLHNPAAKKGANDSVLFPVRDSEAISRRYLRGGQHVTLTPDQRATVGGALFEVEAISPSRPDGNSTILRGGLWFTDEEVDGQHLRKWLGQARFGGELTRDFGRVHCTKFDSDANHYPGLGPADASGLYLRAGDVLGGPSLDGVADAPLVPWLGRLYDEQRGFGRRFSDAVFVRMDGKAITGHRVLPACSEVGFGCWQVVS